MDIHSVKFLTSSQHFAQLPPAKLPEYAFVGRSNVGKSSLINMLTRHKKLAKTSSTPGKTQLINHFEVNSFWYLVDLPGYGYARVSKRSRRGFERLIQDYITKRQSLISVFVLVDIRHTPQELDLEFMEFLGISAIPFVIAFTKADKLTNNQRKKNVATYNKKLLESWEALPQQFVTSAETADGREEMLAYIDENMEFFNSK